MNESIDNRIRTVFQRILHVDPTRLSDATRRGDLAEWDSLGHLLLVNALEEEFCKKLSPEQALDLQTVADAKRLLAGEEK